MGEIYRARDTELGVAGALKTIRSEVASNPQALRRLQTRLARRCERLARDLTAARSALAEAD